MSRLGAGDCHLFFFFNDTATPEIYTLSLHDALPICVSGEGGRGKGRGRRRAGSASGARGRARSEEHTSELQSRQYLVCRLLLEKKKKNIMEQVQRFRRSRRRLDDRDVAGGESRPATQ